MPSRVLLLAIVAIVVVMVLVSLLADDLAITAAFGLAGLIVLGGLALNSFLAKKTRDTRDPVSDRTDAVPSAHLGPTEQEDDRPLGDTPEAHDEVSPHDLPVGHPGRSAAERQAGGESGTTRGHEQGGATSEDEKFGEASRGQGGSPASAG